MTSNFLHSWRMRVDAPADAEVAVQTPTTIGTAGLPRATYTIAAGSSTMLSIEPPLTALYPLVAAGDKQQPGVVIPLQITVNGTTASLIAVHWIKDNAVSVYDADTVVKVSPDGEEFKASTPAEYGTFRDLQIIDNHATVGQKLVKIQVGSVATSQSQSPWSYARHQLTFAPVASVVPEQVAPITRSSSHSTLLIVIAIVACLLFLAIIVFLFNHALTFGGGSPAQNATSPASNEK